MNVKIEIYLVEIKQIEILSLGNQNKKVKLLLAKAQYYELSFKPGVRGYQGEWGLATEAPIPLGENKFYNVKN